MQIVIDILDKDIPKTQDMLEVDFMFIDGHISQCTYPCKILYKDPVKALENIKNNIRENWQSRKSTLDGTVFVKEDKVIEWVDKEIEELTNADSNQYT